MREILFRGKRTDNGKWVTGAPFVAADRCKIIQAVALHPDFVDEGNVYYSEGFPVDPETIGQYTGLTDKNGKKIFEGDIVRNGDYTMIVVWYDFHAAFMLAFRVDGDYFEAISNSHIYLEVIGNIHDNPELLEATT